MTQPAASSRRLNWRVFIPLLMLILAALACDNASVDPLEVDWVAADQTPGHAFAHVTRPINQLDLIYETDDYGQHWHLSNSRPIDANRTSFSMRDETLYLNDQHIWSFPRRFFRDLFLQNFLSEPHFLLPNGEVSAVVQGSTLYVAMGTEGVLVGQFSGNNSLTDWQVTANGIEGLKPTPLAITNPPDILKVIAVQVLLPPYVVLHGYLLYSLWLYLVPHKKARLYAILAALTLLVVELVGSVIWLSNAEIDYDTMTAVVTLITVFICAGITLFFAAGKTRIPSRKWLIPAALLISLIVPVAAAGIYLRWWFVYLTVIGYYYLRPSFWRYFQPKADDWRGRWLVDRLTIETILLAVALLASVGIAVMILGVHFDGYAPFGLLILLILMIVLPHQYAKRRLQQLKITNDDLPPRQLELGIEIGVWLLLCVAATAATFIGQLLAYGWFFTKLLA